MRAAASRRTVRLVHDELFPASDPRCPFCGAMGQDPRAFCMECEMRWEEMECRQLRERLFGVAQVAEVPDRFFAA